MTSPSCINCMPMLSKNNKMFQGNQQYQFAVQ